jgi:hypothetical protein
MRQVSRKMASDFMRFVHCESCEGAIDAAVILIKCVIEYTLRKKSAKLTPSREAYLQDLLASVESTFGAQAKKRRKRKYQSTEKLFEPNLGSTTDTTCAIIHPIPKNGTLH